MHGRGESVERRNIPALLSAAGFLQPFRRIPSVYAGGALRQPFRRIPPVRAGNALRQQSRRIRSVCAGSSVQLPVLVTGSIRATVYRLLPFRCGAADLRNDIARETAGDGRGRVIDMLMRQQGRRRGGRTRLRSWLPRRRRMLLPLCLAGDSAGKGVSVENAAVGITAPGVSSDAQNDTMLTFIGGIRGRV